MLWQQPYHDCHQEQQILVDGRFLLSFQPIAFGLPSSEENSSPRQLISATNSRCGCGMRSGNPDLMRIVRAPIITNTLTKSPTKIILAGDLFLNPTRKGCSTKRHEITATAREINTTLIFSLRPKSERLYRAT